MAFQGNLEIIPGVKAAADLSAEQFRIMVIDSSGDIAVSGAAARAAGVLQDAPDAAGKDASVAFKGISKVQAGAAVVAGTSITADASGDGITASATNPAVGIALTAAGATGELFTMLIMHHTAI